LNYQSSLSYRHVTAPWCSSLFVVTAVITALVSGNLLEAAAVKVASMIVAALQAAAAS
jgi:hypothetical protein